MHIASLDTKTGRVVHVADDKGNAPKNSNIRKHNEDREKDMNSLREEFFVCRQFTSHQIDTYKDIELNRRSW